MSLPYVYQGDYGTQVSVDSGADLSAATLLEILYSKPDGSTGTWTGATTDNQHVTYTSQSGDFDAVGTWTFRIRVTEPSGLWYGGKGQFEVRSPNL